jgi:hypothetical protein
MTTAPDSRAYPELLTEAEMREITPKVADHIRYRDELIVRLQQSMTAREDLLKEWVRHADSKWTCSQLQLENLAARSRTILAKETTRG